MEKVPDEYCLDLDPSKYELIADLGSVLYLNVANLDTALFLQAASLQKGKCVTAHAPGFKFVAEQPKLASCPLVIRQSGGADRGGLHRPVLQGDE